MSVLLRKLRHINSAVASVLERADIRTDSEIQSLTREDLHELFPGPEKLKLRRAIFEIIHEQKPINVLLRELKDFIPHDTLRAALSRNGLLIDYLCILKGLRSQVDKVQSFLDAHISFLEKFNNNQPDQEPDKGVLSSTSTSALYAPVEQNSIPSDFHPYEAQVLYQMVISGKTFDAHLQLMASVQAQVHDQVQLISCNQDSQIILVFCQVTSHNGSDIDSAMTYITENVPVILVLMHHTHEVKQHTELKKAWSDCSNIVLYVNVFYHEAAHGLLRCRENTVAVSQIKDKLLEFSSQRKKWIVNGVITENNDFPNGNERGTLIDDAGSEFGFRIFGDTSSSSSTTSSSNSETKSIWEGGD